jgi:hypothetical protein
MTDIDDDLRLAVECLVEAHGHAGAIKELQARVDAGRDGEPDRALAGLAWLRREGGDD